MSKKRARSTGTDEYYQLLRFTGTLDVTDTAKQFVLAIPVPRIFNNKNQPRIIEVLWAKFWGTEPTATANGRGSVWMLSTSSVLNVSGDITLDPGTAPGVFGALRWAGSIVTSGAMQVEQPKVMNFEDNTGRGYLVATDKIYIYYDTIAAGAATSFSMMLAYKFVDVTAEEYVGIVQSQQSA